MDDSTFLGNGDELWNNPTNKPNPLLLWLTINADYCAGHMYDFAAAAVEARDLPDDVGSEDKIVDVHVLGPDGPKLASFTVRDAAPQLIGFVVRVVCPHYELDVSRTATA